MFQNFTYVAFHVGEKQWNCLLFQTKICSSSQTQDKTCTPAPSSSKQPQAAPSKQPHSDRHVPSYLPIAVKMPHSPPVSKKF